MLNAEMLYQQPEKIDGLTQEIQRKLRTDMLTKKSKIFYC